MYFLVALGLAALSTGLWYFFKDKKKELHFEILAITFGAATLMWVIDCIASAVQGEGFLSFDMPIDIYISIWTLAAGVVFWGIITLILNIKKKQ